MKNDIQTNDVCYMINGEPVKFYYDHEDEGYHICGQWNGSNITELYIPDTINGKPVVWVDGDTYDCMVKLERIVVSHEHRHFTTVDGALRSKDMKTLFWYPTKRKDKVYFVPQGVIHIGDSALSNPFVETIVLPEGTEWVYSYGIAGARNLTELYVPVSMKQFMFKAMLGCSSLKHIYYEGTEEQWKDVDISDENFNFPLVKAKVHFGCTMPKSLAELEK